MGFQVDNVEAVLLRYEKLHPCLIHYYDKYGDSSILEVYAYYQHDGEYSSGIADIGLKRPDVGTLIRFVETKEKIQSPDFCILPGLRKVPAEFDDESRPAYFDHWVSVYNVVVTLPLHASELLTFGFVGCRYPTCSVEPSFSVPCTILWDSNQR